MDVSEVVKTNLSFLSCPEGVLLAGGPLRAPSLRRFFVKSIFIIRFSNRLQKRCSRAARGLLRAHRDAVAPLFA